MPPHRQVHLDFHTSEHIPGVGADFEPGRFADTLKQAQVDSVVLFAKCHHGWSYYDTGVGVRHPTLDFDLLNAQISACRDVGIGATIYLSVGWDERAARANPGWRRVLPDGSFHMMLGKNLDPYWSYLCLNSPYLDDVLAQTSELAARFPGAEGFWFDIIRLEQCCCSYCRSGMDAQGLDWTQEADRKRFARTVLDRYLERATAAARSVTATTSVFHNSSMLPRGDRRFLESMSHVEIEAVPTGGWGYDHFPMSARYVDALAMPAMGVTVRFHIVWGEMGGFKHPNALRAEAMTMLAHGAAVCIGDHLHPRGALDDDAYRMIGTVFSEAASKAPFLSGTRPLADVGLLSSIAVRRPGSLERADRHIAEDEGALRVLQQGHIPFDVIDAEADFGRYRALVLPDRLRLSEGLARKLESYRAQGGGLLMTGESGLNEDASGFALDLGAEYFGPSPFDPTFVDPLEVLRPSFLQGPFSLFGPSFRVRAREEANALGAVIEPYFQRSQRMFSGHINTPARPEPSSFACGVKRGRAVYLAHPVFSIYRQLGHAVVRDYALAALAMALDGPPSLQADLPREAITTLRLNEREGRVVLQVVYAPRTLRGDTLLGPLEVIEDLPVLRDIAFDLAVPWPVGQVLLQPGAEGLAFEQHGGRLRFSLPRLAGHALVELRRA